jgi:hypothetical protein
MAVLADADATLDAYRRVGLAVRLGVRVQPLVLPRRRSVRRALARAAEHDLRVRAALRHAEDARAKPDDGPVIY